MDRSKITIAYFQTGPVISRNKIFKYLISDLCVLSDRSAPFIFTCVCKMCVLIRAKHALIHLKCPYLFILNVCTYSSEMYLLNVPTYSSEMYVLIHPKCMYLFIRNVYTYSSEMYVLIHAK